MASQPIDNAAFLSHLEAQLRDFKAKVVALEATISALKSAMAVGALEAKPRVPAPVSLVTQQQNPPQPPATPVSAPPRPKPYAGMSIPSAIAALLAAVPQRGYSALEIANALQRNGVESTSDNFTNVVTAALHRLKERGDKIEDKEERANHVQKFSDGWGLNKWGQGWDDEEEEEEEEEEKA